MQYFSGQVAAILKEFKVTAEIIDWDTTILGRGNSLNSDTKIEKLKLNLCIFNQ